MSIAKTEASKQLIPVLAALLQKKDQSFTDLSLCAVSRGPGPFTTLRTVIATMNGLSYATGISLVGVNALEVLITQYDVTNTKQVIALLNAFGGDVYFGMRLAGGTQTTMGAGPSSHVFTIIDDVCSDGVVHVVGNAAAAHEQALYARYGDRVRVEQAVRHGTLAGIARHGADAWAAGERGVTHLKPVYLKDHPAQRS